MSSIASDPKNSCWVFASAGSGKTKILVDRIVRLLLEDVAPNKILCLTFTKVAAAEMEQRINSKLAEFVLADEQILAEKLYDLTGRSPSKDLLRKARTAFARVLDAEGRLKIQTIHAFCQTLIKIFPFEAGIKPSFEVIEDLTEKLLLQRAQKEAIRDQSLAEIVKKIHSRMHDQTIADLLSELLSKREKIDFNLVEPSGSADAIFAKFIQKLDREENLSLARRLDETGLKDNQKTSQKIRLFFDQPQIDNFEILQSAFFTDKGELRKVRGKAVDDLVAITQKQFDLINNFSEELNSFYIAEDTYLLIKFTKEVLQKYSQIKSKMAVLDYNDLINQTNKLLNNPDFAEWIKMKMDSSFDHILVDESQDTNRQQWSIIKALIDDFFSGLSQSNRQRSIFIVGDEKQSIYSFQGAEPDISQEIFSYFKQKFGDGFKKIELHQSYRSLPKILSAVDKIFLNPQRKLAISKVSDFDGHKPTRKGEGVVEIWSKAENPKELSARILQWIKDKNFGDVMILLRQKKGEFFEDLVRNFRQHQIPFSSISKIKFSDSVIVRDMLSAARFALLPCDDLNLACLLKSPFFNFSESDLFAICDKKNRDQTSIFKALEGTEVRKKLDDIMQKSLNFNVFEFFYFLDYQGFDSSETLRKFQEIVFNFCQNSSPNLQKFIEFVDKVDPEISLSATENDRVKISTIHGAKGLQSKIVLIADCVFDLNKSRSNKNKIFWIDGQPIWCAKKEFENQLVKTYRAERFREIREENLRLLYVAMTRAEDQLHIAGFGNAKDPECWYEIASNELGQNS